MVTERDIFHLFVHFPDGYNHQGQTEASSQGLHLASHTGAGAQILVSSSGALLRP